ncbi:MAG TPA: tripartite tricarboxylate transporter substrate binding protein [Burkholderiales bacterium]|nr:tripartite tricarboxylate transporter substrate binding protein [Burkholderiales bacterium]
MKSCFRMVLPALLAALIFPIASSTVQAAYPERPVRVLVVFPPGGSNDVTARIVFQKMPEIMGQQFVVENRGGASGTIGAQVVANSAPDGYTIMIQSTTHIANAYMYRGKIKYDTLGDFVGVTALARQVAMLVVHPSMPVKTTQELVALARKRPGEVTYGSAGLGSFTHLTMAMFTSMSKTNILHVPYKGGGPSSVALISGEVQSNIGTIGSLFPHLKAGRIRALGVTSPERVKAFPNVPTIGEAVPGYEFTAWVGCLAPKGTPKPIIDALNAALKKALADPGVSSKLSAQTLDPLYMTPEQFDARLKSDYDRYGKLMKQIGIIK